MLTYNSRCLSLPSTDEGNPSTPNREEFYHGRDLESPVFFGKRRAGALAASSGRIGMGRGCPQASPMLDIHIHLFGIGDDSSGCLLSKEITEKPTFKLLEQILNLRERAKTLDKGYELALAELLKNSGLAERRDSRPGRRLRRQGQVRYRPERRSTRRTITSSQVTARYPEMMIPCVSINPDRADALDELNRCAEKGARILKIHPPIQGVDPGDKKHARFFRRCAELKVMVMVHTGHEHSSPIVDIGLASPLKLELALDQGCTVVACHCGTGRPDRSPRHAAGLFGHGAEIREPLGRYLRPRRFRAGRRISCGSWTRNPSSIACFTAAIFPSPPSLCYSRKGSAWPKPTQLQSISNMIQQDLALKEALGIGRASAERAYRLVVQTEDEA